MDSKSDILEIRYLRDSSLQGFFLWLSAKEVCYVKAKYAR